MRGLHRPAPGPRSAQVACQRGRGGATGRVARQWVPWRRPTRKWPRCCGSTPTCSGWPAATRSARGPTSGRPSPSAGTRGTSRRSPMPGLTKIPGVGSSIAGKIAEHPPHRHVRRPGGAAGQGARREPGSCPRCPGVGPRRALQIAGELGISSAAELAEAIRDGRLRGVAGLGPKSEERILRGLGVADGDAALRDALRALPDGASAGDIYAVLAAHVPGGRRPRRRPRPARSRPGTSAATCTPTPT